MILGVLLEISELAGGLDPGSHLGAAGPFQLLDLLFERRDGPVSVIASPYSLRAPSQIDGLCRVVIGMRGTRTGAVVG